MKLAWVIGSPGDLLAAVDRGLAHIGYQPRFVTPGQLPAQLEEGAAADAPALLVLVDDVERAAEQVAAHPELCEVPAIVVADAQRLATGGYSAVGHELLVQPWSDVELEVRVARARRAVNGPEPEELIVTGTLELNTATYQVTVDGQVIGFTYMEYELLKFLVTNPDRVFSRDALLQNVWGYDYYGGARTVDVHVRRLRAKLGQEHAARIRTLRSVGYRWDSRRS
ncbi:MAG: winged helix-turn-helix domain-containing protein [Solirubrobacteraceae bacterium]|nr:winged helix-turn-helix domain-containing protein [Solirubrobacteraceae bacterium]